MDIAKYLLSIEEFMDTEKGEALLKRASLCVDEERRRKAEGMRTLSGRAACLGAGLLLQLAVEEALQGRRGSFGGSSGFVGDSISMGRGFIRDGVSTGSGSVRDSVNTDSGFRRDGVRGDSRFLRDDALADRRFAGDGAPASCDGMKVYSAAQLLQCREVVPVRPFVYKYGTQGKPCFVNLPFYFNLSHSGSYVLCGLSMEEIGADIQQHCGKDVGKLGWRFYSKRESMALEQAGAERENLFYRLWARKEAYGKLTGEGIGKALGMDMLPGTVRTEEGEGYGTFSCSSQILTSETVSLPEGRHLVWEEWDSVEGYSIAFCRYR